MPLRTGRISTMPKLQRLPPLSWLPSLPCSGSSCVLSASATFRETVRSTTGSSCCLLLLLLTVGMTTCEGERCQHPPHYQELTRRFGGLQEAIKLCM